MPTATPRHTRRWAVRALYAFAPLAVVCFICWTLQWPISGLHRPPIMFALYQLFMCLSIAAGTVALVATGQLAVAKAFAAGYLAGVQHVVNSDGDGSDGDGGDHPKHRRPLRSVQ